MNDKVLSNIRRLPAWLKTPLPGGKNFTRLKAEVGERGLHTVCESASCPNMGECWNSGTLTLMILGDHCTRACRFCDVPTGELVPPREEEPEEVAAMLANMNLRYVVITSVDRDDLPDGGSTLWARTVLSIRRSSPDLKIETLIPDFQGRQEQIANVCAAGPDVLSHNIETVRPLQKKVRPQCRYEWSLKTLEIAHREFNLITKSGLMLGHGEKKEEVVETMRDLVQTGCRILTIGQYLRPSRQHLEVEEYVHPDVFAELRELGEAMGFEHVESGPLVRSSYLADRQARAVGI